jgi:hypothetical protein
MDQQELRRQQTPSLSLREHLRAVSGTIEE